MRALAYLVKEALNPVRRLQTFLRGETPYFHMSEDPDVALGKEVLSPLGALRSGRKLKSVEFGYGTERQPGPSVLSPKGEDLLRQLEKDPRNYVELAKRMHKIDPLFTIPNDPNPPWHGYKRLAEQVVSPTASVARRQQLWRLIGKGEMLKAPASIALSLHRPTYVYGSSGVVTKPSAMKGELLALRPNVITSILTGASNEAHLSAPPITGGPLLLPSAAGVPVYDPARLTAEHGRERGIALAREMKRKGGVALTGRTWRYLKRLARRPA